jgi:hypothetical protein
VSDCVYRIIGQYECTQGASAAWELTFSVAGFDGASTNIPRLYLFLRNAAGGQADKAGATEQPFFLETLVDDMKIVCLDHLLVLQLSLTVLLHLTMLWKYTTQNDFGSSEDTIAALRARGKVRQSPLHYRLNAECLIVRTRAMEYLPSQYFVL